MSTHELMVPLVPTSLRSALHHKKNLTFCREGLSFDPSYVHKHPFVTAMDTVPSLRGAHHARVLNSRLRRSEAADASTQGRLHPAFGFEEDGEERGANFSLTAGWPGTNLIIIIVKKAQRKPAAVPRFHRNPIERLLALVMIYKVTSQTDLL